MTTLKVSNFMTMNSPPDYCYKVVGRKGRNDHFVGKFLKYNEFIARPGEPPTRKLIFQYATFLQEPTMVFELEELEFYRVGCWTGSIKGGQSRRQQNRRHGGRKGNTRRNRKNRRGTRKN